MLAPVLSTDMPASSAITQELLGWKPTHPGLIEDIEQGPLLHLTSPGRQARQRAAVPGGVDLREGPGANWPMGCNARLVRDIYRVGH
jgi:hypothetical protein